MANFRTGPREMTATMSFSAPRITEISLTYAYSILWTGEDYEVTVYEDEPVDNEVVQFVDRANRETLAHCVSFVKGVLKRDILQMAQDMVVFEEEI
jgi:hypothetical protein